MLGIDLVGCPVLDSISGQFGQFDVAELREYVVAEDGA
jgi:hypothetical protein